MTDFPLDQIICGIPELGWHTQSGVTHIVSILDPFEPEPGAFAEFPPHERLTLRFDDIIAPAAGYAAPSHDDIEQLLEFGRRIGTEALSTLLIHCHAGVSRSTASAAALLFQAWPDANPDAIFDHVGRIRPQAWPNSRMIAFADTQLARRGTMVAALHRFYGRRLESDPALGPLMRRGGRAAEVELAVR
jgi:predicted protein tyrosine phosphatase